MSKRPYWLATACAACLAPHSVAAAQTAAELLASTQASVVLVLSGDGDTAGGSGAGFVATDEGHVVTLAQIVCDPKSHAPYPQLYVYLRPATLALQAGSNLTERYRAHVVAANSEQGLDIAVLALEDAPATMAALRFGKACSLPPDASVLAVGHAESGGLWSAQRLRVAADSSRSAAPVAPAHWGLDRGVGFGQWGGPVVDGSGAVLGMVMAPQPIGQSRRAKERATRLAAPGQALSSASIAAWLASHALVVNWQTQAVDASPAKAISALRAPAGDPIVHTAANCDGQSTPQSHGENMRQLPLHTKTTHVATELEQQKSQMTVDHAPAKNFDSFVHSRRPYSLRQTRRHQLRAPLGASALSAAACATSAASSADKVRRTCRPN